MTNRRYTRQHLNDMEVKSHHSPTEQLTPSMKFANLVSQLKQLENSTLILSNNIDQTDAEAAARIKFLEDCVRDREDKIQEQSLTIDDLEHMIKKLEDREMQSLSISSTENTDYKLYLLIASGFGNVAFITYFLTMVL